MPRCARRSVATRPQPAHQVRKPSHEPGPARFCPRPRARSVCHPDTRPAHSDDRRAGVLQAVRRRHWARARLGRVILQRAEALPVASGEVASSVCSAMLATALLAVPVATSEPSAVHGPRRGLSAWERLRAQSNAAPSSRAAAPSLRPPVRRAVDRGRCSCTRLAPPARPPRCRRAGPPLRRRLARDARQRSIARHAGAAPSRGCRSGGRDAAGPTFGSAVARRRVSVDRGVAGIPGATGAAGRLASRAFCGAPHAPSPAPLSSPPLSLLTHPRLRPGSTR